MFSFNGGAILVVNIQPIGPLGAGRSRTFSIERRYVGRVRIGDGWRRRARQLSCNNKKRPGPVPVYSGSLVCDFFFLNSFIYNN